MLVLHQHRQNVVAHMVLVVNGGAAASADTRKSCSYVLLPGYNNTTLAHSSSKLELCWWRTAPASASELHCCLWEVEGEIGGDLKLSLCSFSISKNQGCYMGSLLCYLGKIAHTYIHTGKRTCCGSWLS